MTEARAFRPPAPNPVLEEILRTQRVRTPDGDLVELHSHVSPREGAFLQWLVRETSAVRTLEIGLAFGVSALYVCDALPRVPEACHVAIDPAQRRPTRISNGWRGIGLANLERAGYADLVEFHDEPSHVVLPRLLEQERRFDLAFVDGWHTFDHALLDFFYADLLLPAGGVVAFDDAHYPSIRAVCRYVARNRAYTVCGTVEREPILERTLVEYAADEEIGLDPAASCIAFRKDGEDERPWDFHVAF